MNNNFMYIPINDFSCFERTIIENISNMLEYVENMNMMRCIDKMRRFIDKMRRGVD